MSSIGETILAAIDDGARTHADIVEATGLESKQVSNHLFVLKSGGAVSKADYGYVRADGAAAPKAHVHEAAPGDQDAPPLTRKRGRQRKTKRAEPVPKSKRRKRRAKTRPKTPKRANGHDDHGAASAVEFARFGEFVVLRKSDVVELLAVMERWRQMIEAQ